MDDEWVSDDGEWDSGMRIVVSSGGENRGPVWIPATVPLDLVLFRSEEVAIWLSGFRVTPERMSFELEARYRHVSIQRRRQPPVPEAEQPPVPSLDGATEDVGQLERVWASYQPSQAQHEASKGLGIGLRFGDRWGEWIGERDGCRGEGLDLWSESTSSGGGRHHAWLRCSAVPDGDVTFWTKWERLGVPRTEAVVPAEVFRAGTAGSVLLWGEDNGA